MTFIPNEGSPNLPGELVLWRTAVRWSFYRTRGHQTWPENCCCCQLLSGNVYTKRGVTKLGRRTPAVINCYPVTFIPNKGWPNLAGEHLLRPTTIRWRLYQTRIEQTWPENSYCDQLLSGDVYTKRGVTKSGRRTPALTNCYPVTLYQTRVDQTWPENPAVANCYRVTFIPKEGSPNLAGELLLWPTAIRWLLAGEPCCGQLLAGDVYTKQGLTKLGRRTLAVAICYQVTFISSKDWPNLAGELLLWPTAIRWRLYQTRVDQTWPENSCCDRVLSDDCLGPVFSLRNVGSSIPHRAA